MQALFGRMWELGKETKDGISLLCCESGRIEDAVMLQRN